MTEQSHISEVLIREIVRYLAAVDLFRAEHCEPRWLSELAPSGNSPVRRSPKLGASSS